jgi:hypothetical protein
MSVELEQIAICVACNGTARASNGAPCVPCKGNGRNPAALAPNLTAHKLAAGDTSADLMLAQRCVQFFESLPCATQADYEQCGELIKQAKQFAESYDARRTAITKPLNDAKREVDSWLMPIVKAYEQAVQIGKRKLVEYQSAQARERERIAHQMAAQHAQGNTQGVLALAADAQATITPQVEGIQTRKVKAWRVIDASAIPRDYLIVNRTAVDEAMHNGVAVPGIEYYEESQIAVRK